MYDAKTRGYLCTHDEYERAELETYERQQAELRAIQTELRAECAETRAEQKEYGGRQAETCRLRAELDVLTCKAGDD